MTIQQYVIDHIVRGECQCGKCCDKDDKPDPTHGVNMGFFKVGASNLGPGTVEEFRQLTLNTKGEFGDVDIFDGKEHNYMELGGWIGDQELAMQYMALGTILGVFKLLTPWVLLPSLPEEMKMQMAEQGFLSIKSKEKL